jgi:hypothetical protein
MIKLKYLLLAGAIGLACSPPGLAQDTSAKPPGQASAGMAAVVDEVLAQEPSPEALPGAPDAGVGSGVLEAMPRPRDIPRSLFEPAPPPSGQAVPLDRPYFIQDPLLDFAPFAAPGWFAGAEAQIVKPHLLIDNASGVFPGRSFLNAPGLRSLGGNSTTVNLSSANLNWTAAPRVFLGYRLPSGFGELMASWQHLGTTGSGSAPNVAGPVGINTRFAYDIVDFDYNSRELSLWDRWDLKWTFGLRMLFLFYNTQATQPFDQAAGSNGIAFAQQSNNMFGLGPHAAIELNRRFGDSRWSFYCRGDFSASLDYVNDEWSTLSTALDGRGRPTPGQVFSFGHQAAPIVTGRAGLSWRPSPTSGTRLFIGYQYMSIWNLNVLPQFTAVPYSPPSTGQLWTQGVVLQATFNY